MKTLLVLLLMVPLLSLGLLGCPGDEPVDEVSDGPVDIDIEPTDVESDALDLAGADCVPGETRCLGEGRLDRCSEVGEWVFEDCEPSAVCFEGQCGVPGTCEALRIDMCRGYGYYQGCNPVGTYEGDFEVPFGLTCVNRDGVDQLVERTCFPGQTMCSDERDLWACAESGLDFEYAVTCQQEDPLSLCDDGECIPLCQFIEKRNTYIGCTYWGVDLDNAFVTGFAGIPFDAYHAQYAIAVTNPSDEFTAEITFDTYGRVLAMGQVPPLDMTVFLLPESEIEGSMIGYWGYRLTSNIPVVAFQFNPLSNVEVFSNDASLLLPESSLGTDHYIMTRRQTFDELRGTLTVVATQEGETDVMVRLPPATLENPLVTLGSATVPRMEGGDVATFTLQQFQVLNIETNRPGSDLTGTYIEATRPVAVFGGSEAANAPDSDSCVYRPSFDDWRCEFNREVDCFDEELQAPNIGLCAEYITCCADHLEQQLPPISAWGRQFNAARSAPRGDEADIWRVLAKDDDTIVTLMGIPSAPGEPFPLVFELDAGGWHEFQSRADFEIQATNPVFVGQFLAAEFAPNPEDEPNPVEYPVDAGVGDPAFIMVVPREQYRSDYIFLVPLEYAENWVTIVAPLGTDVTHVDGSGESVLLAADQFMPMFEGAQWSVLRLQLEREGYHRLDAETAFGAMVHGYDSFVSYGYPAGMDLRELN